MEKLLTIIIPSYNVERTLQQTVESLMVSDKRLLESLDILIVNDGSKDGTLELASRLERENPGVVRVWNKENGGHGSTINVGIEQGYGKYLKVVDGDDWLDTEAFEKYLHILSETDADLVATDYYRYYMNIDKMTVMKSSECRYGKMLHFSDIWKDYSFYMLSFAVKTALMRNQKYRIDEHCFYVDVEFDTLAALMVETILYVDMKLYVYRLEHEGQSVSVEGLIKHYPDHAKVMLTLIQWHKVLSEKLPKEKISYLENRILDSTSWHYKLGFEFPEEEKRIFIHHVKKIDVQIKREDTRVYKLIGKNRVVKVLRLARFVPVAYYALGVLTKAKNSLKQT